MRWEVAGRCRSALAFAPIAVVLASGFWLLDAVIETFLFDLGTFF